MDGEGKEWMQSEGSASRGSINLLRRSVRDREGGGGHWGAWELGFGKDCQDRVGSTAETRHPRASVSSPLLLSSFACAICPHRPVLDTLAMLTAHRAGKKHLSSKLGRRHRIENKALTFLQTPRGALLLRLFPFSAGLQLFYGKQQPGKGMEQNPRPQNELEREETKAEVTGEMSVCSRQDLRLEGLWLLGGSADSVLISMPGSSVNPDASYHPKCFAQSSSLQQLLPPEVQVCGVGKPVAGRDKRRQMALKCLFSRLCVF